MKKELNSKLKEKQEKEREESKAKVLRAIEELKNEGFEVSTKLLIERTGLSRSTFSKSHIIDVLRQEKVCRFKNSMTLKDKDSNQYLLEVEKRIRELEVENQKLKKDLNLQINKNLKLEFEIAEKQEQCEVLRGQLMVLYQKASNRGIELEQ